jgi:small subunit ribosomal protein S17
MAEAVKNNKKVFVGEVVSDKMDKTIVVKIVRPRLHSIYHKYVMTTKKIKAHDEKNEAHVGDKVRVIECRPVSRDKRWNLVEIVERAR